MQWMREVFDWLMWIGFIVLVLGLVGGLSGSSDC
jgi:hypothetical protein